MLAAGLTEARLGLVLLGSCSAPALARALIDTLGPGSAGLGRAHLDPAQEVVGSRPWCLRRGRMGLAVARAVLHGVVVKALQEAPRARPADVRVHLDLEE
eukprot:9789242-Alexandrium_andersonii.AAC.1